MEIVKQNTNSLDEIKSCVDNAFIDKIKECLKSIKEVHQILIRYTTNKNNKKLQMEIEYTKLMLNLVVPLLNAFISDQEIEEFKKDITQKIDYFKKMFEQLRIQFQDFNTNYFSDEEKYLFLRNYDILNKMDAFGKTKCGLNFLRFLFYYLNKLENKVVEIYLKDFNLNSEDLSKYAYKVRFKK
jgi:hypothetical protein